MRKSATLLSLAVTATALANEQAHLADTTFTLPEIVTISPKEQHLNEAVNLDLKVNPVKSSQEVLRIVPGLFIAQHAGGGKAASALPMSWSRPARLAAWTSSPSSEAIRPAMWLTSMEWFSTFWP